MLGLAMARPSLAGAVSLTLAIVAGPACADLEYGLLAPHQGERVTAVGILGNKVTRPNVVLREIRTRVGDPLDLATLQADFQRLENLQIFANIWIVAEDDGVGQVRLRYVLKEMPSWLPTLALAYTEENGVSLGPGLVAYNLSGRDIDVSVKTYFGGTTQYSMEGGWPWIGGNDHLGVQLRAAHLNRDDKLNGFHETSDEITPRVSRYLGEHGRISGMLSFFKVGSDVAGKTLSPDNTDHLRRLGATLGWDTRDSWSNPRHGWLNELEVWRTGGFLGGDGDFWTTTLDIRRWQPTTPRQKVLLSGLVSLQSGTVGEDVPEYLQYRLGGANTIRGYDYQKLGEVLFGKSQMIGTVEYAFTAVPPRQFKLGKLRLRLGVELALFADAGIAWSRSEDLTLRRARAGGGAGIRLLTPVSEMIRVDFGWSPEGGLQVHVAGGSKPKRQRARIR
jgi:outer membrane protein insertion porin family